MESVLANSSWENRLFVYGTLRPGSNNEHAQRLACRATHIGTGRVPGLLFQVANYPALALPVRNDDWVVGDVFEDVPNQIMHELDTYEGPDYFREAIEVNMEDGRILKAYLYRWILPTDNLKSISSGDWKAFSKRSFQPG